MKRDATLEDGEIMEQLYSQAYDTPYGYVEDAVVPLAGINFTVIDAIRGYPVPGAFCVIHAGIDGTGDADGVYTDNEGKAGIDAKWFVPRSWSVSKEGYLTKISNQMSPIINVALESTTVQYTVRIYTGTGGSTDPSGALIMTPGTRLTVRAIPNSGYAFDRWTYKGQDAGSINPQTFLIDRDGITIIAAFKEGVEPPPNGEPPPPPPPPPPTAEFPWVLPASLALGIILFALGTARKTGKNNPTTKSNTTPSQNWINHWEEQRLKYIRLGKPLTELKARIIRHKSSLLLGREFGENADSFKKRRGLTEYYEWKPKGKDWD